MFLIEVSLELALTNRLKFISMKKIICHIRWLILCVKKKKQISGGIFVPLSTRSGYTVNRTLVIFAPEKTHPSFYTPTISCSTFKGKGSILSSLALLHHLFQENTQGESLGRVTLQFFLTP